MHQSGQLRAPFNGALLTIALASFAAGQERHAIDPPPSPGRETIEPVNTNLSLPALNEEQRQFQKELSRFNEIDRSKFQPTVSHAAMPTLKGMIDYIYLFEPIEPDQTKPVVVIGLLPNAESHTHLDRHLCDRNFSTSVRPYAELLRELEKLKDPPDAEARTNLSRTAELLKLLAQALISLTLMGIASIKLYAMHLKRRSVKQLQRAVAEREKSAGQPSEHSESNPHSYRFEIRGGTQPMLCFNLAPGERVIAEAGSMLYRDSTTTSKLTSASVLGLSGKLPSTGQSLLSGESLFYLNFENLSDSDSNLVLGPSRIGQILNLNLADYPNGLSASNGAFFAATPGVKMEIARFSGWKSLFSGTGLFYQQFSGLGQLFLFTAGTVECVELKQGEVKLADSDSIFAWEKGVTVELKRQTLAETALSGEGLVIARISGQGKVWFAARGRSDDSSSNEAGGLLTSLIRNYLAS